jgi:hypothetical protein
LVRSASVSRRLQNSAYLPGVSAKVPMQVCLAGKASISPMNAPFGELVLVDRAVGGLSHQLPEAGRLPAGTSRLPCSRFRVFSG